MTNEITDRLDASSATRAEPRVVVGIGASAGGLEAFQQLISTIPRQHQHAYVIVQHLDPNHTSLLPELLAKRTSAAVKPIEDGMEIESGTIHLIPPGSSLSIEDGRLKLTSFEEPRGHRRPIDTFFISLAEAYGENCAAIVLSGTGSDGSAGIAAVKEKGGLVFVQDPKQAKYDGMPSNAIATKAVDLVLPAAEMVSVIDEYFSRRQGIEPLIENDMDFVERVSKHVRYRTGHDFSAYKKGTMLRRISRRMSVLGCDSAQAYLQKLISDQTEVQLLFKDLLINVTSFFRDRDAFDTLRESCLRPLLQDRGQNEEIRIWVPGCSTGQEAYSIAMLVYDEMQRTDGHANVSIFATDIDNDALEVARGGIYPGSIASEVPIHLLEQCCVSDGDGYRIADPIREMVRVSKHNLISDPPFSKLDLVSCRNILIYFEPELQKEVLPLFHYALKENAYLFLGSSETPAPMTGEFAAISQGDRLYLRKPGPSRPLQLPFRSRGFSFPTDANPALAETDRPAQGSKYDAAVLKSHVAPYVVINEARDIVYSSKGTGAYLELAPGSARLGLIEMARPEIKAALRSLLAVGHLTVGKVKTREFSGNIGGNPTQLLLTLERLAHDEYLLVFQDRLDLRNTGAVDVTLPATSSETDPQAEDYISDLERQLDAAQQTIRTTIEELETSNEELKSSNEEMMSMNEELQSANEELSTVNDELNDKIRELNDKNDDLANFMNSSLLAMMFLDADLKVRDFTPAAQDYFRVVEADKGRPFDHVKSNLVADDLSARALAVLKDGTDDELEVDTSDGEEVLSIRLSPYKTSLNEIAGVVIVAYPVTEVRQYARRLEYAERDASESRMEIEELYRVSPQAMALVDRDLKYLRVNERMEKLNGFPIDEHIGKSILDLFPQFHDEILEPATQVLETGKPVIAKEVSGATPADPQNEHTWLVDWYPIRRDGEIYALGINAVDVTGQRTLERQLRDLMQELQHRVKNMLGNVTSLINQAKRDNRDPQAVMDTLVKRIGALSKTHNLLTHENWGPTRLRAVLDLELTDVYGPERVSLKGPDLMINPRGTLGLGMAVHELATNAAKYGALSMPEGKLSVNGSRVDEGDGEKFSMVWKEIGGPKVEEPTRSGFGSNLVKATIQGSLQGAIEQHFEPDGFQCVISVPMTNLK